MCTANTIITKSVYEIIELKKMKADIEREIAKHQSIVTDFMDSQNAESMIAGAYVVKNTTYIQNRVDTGALKDLLGADALEPYTSHIVSKRFTIK